MNNPKQTIEQAIKAVQQSVGELATTHNVRALQLLLEVQKEFDEHHYNNTSRKDIEVTTLIGHESGHMSFGLGDK
ncbi:hypothetical protein [Scytonema sp. NUACC26]|uniref:hypothetical protein n=1 Tax=Scytonema sp. NUACC26 TaxID=3140176 RepID=UPI0034DCB418